MKYRIYFSLLLSIALISCGEPKTESASVEQAADTAQSHQDNIVHASVTNDSGTTLDMTFNNTQGTALFIVNGDTIDMKQDTMASGVKYSNSSYEYNEWQGNITLKKDGKVIFEQKDASS
jgi:membrane-bound inhibitor of C-type lysozyme